MQMLGTRSNGAEPLRLKPSSSSIGADRRKQRSMSGQRAGHERSPFRGKLLRHSCSCGWLLLHCALL